MAAPAAAWNCSPDYFRLPDARATFHSANPGTRDAGRRTWARMHTRNADGQTTRTDSPSPTFSVLRRSRPQSVVPARTRSRRQALIPATAPPIACRKALTPAAAPLVAPTGHRWRVPQRRRTPPASAPPTTPASPATALAPPGVTSDTHWKDVRAGTSNLPATPSDV